MNNPENNVQELTKEKPGKVDGGGIVYHGEPKAVPVGYEKRKSLTEEALPDISGGR